MGQLAAAILILFGLEADGPAPPGRDPTDALTIRLTGPDRQLEELLALFQGARAPHPAAALAAWKRANPGVKGLPKAVEAAIASMNPGMVRELRSLDEARIGFGLDPIDGHLRWCAVAPRDDGSFAGLATAMALTDGGSDAPLGGVAVDRLGPAGAPLRARTAGVLTLAASRVDLPGALRQAAATDAPAPNIASGLSFRVEPGPTPAGGPLSTRRMVEALLAAGCRDMEGTLVLKGEMLELATTARLGTPAASPAIDAAWLDWAPAEGLAAALAVAIDPSPGTWDAAFAWADRVERVDPVRAQLAPLRTRVNLAATAAGVRPEVDLWPRLRGLSAFASSDDSGKLQRLVVALHVADPAAAQELADRFLPRALAALVKGSKPVERADGIQRLGAYWGRPLELTHHDRTVLIGWGDSALDSALAAQSDPARSAAAALRALWGSAPPQRLAAVWPGRLGSPLLADAPPISWIGRNDGTTFRDLIRWAGLHGVVRRGLERLRIDGAPPAGL